VEEALDHAQALMSEAGAGAVSVSEIARRMGMRAPSLYKYFPSRNAIYDALFARGNAEVSAYIDAAIGDAEPGLERLLVASRAMARWCTVESGLASLLYWRPVPGFQPSPESFAPSRQLWQRFREDLAVAARRRQLTPDADSDAAMRLLTIVIAGISSQHMANEPDASFETGAFTSLTEPALQMFVHRYTPTRRKAAS
jgi:AcrR family transcriptional regulator